MGRRSEQRIAASLPVIVRGIDSNGNPFTQMARTHDVSASGGRLEGLVGIERPGTELEVEYQGRRAHFRVQWVGPVGTRIAGLAGVRCIEEGKYIWGVHLGDSAPDEYNHNHPREPVPDSPAAILANSNALAAVSSREPVPWAGNELRQFPRVACRIEAHLATAGSSLFLPGTATDICLGGCNFEMLSPLPLHSEVDILLCAADNTIRSRGRVCSVMPGMGMGVSFTGMSPDDLRKLRHIVPAVPGSASSCSSPATPPGDTAPPHATNDAVIERSRLRNGGGTGDVMFFSSRPPTRTEKESDGSRVDDSSITSIPQIPPTTAEALEAVVRVLFRKGVLNRTELSAELQRLKSARS